MTTLFIVALDLYYPIVKLYDMYVMEYVYVHCLKPHQKLSHLDTFDILPLWIVAHLYF